MTLNALELIAIPVLPLIGAMLAGFFGWFLKERLTHLITCSLVIISAIMSIDVFVDVFNGASYYGNLWTLIVSDNLVVPVGMMIDPLTTIMMVTVTIVSACVHVYTIGYMQGDPGYTRFFSYISAFTFSMLVLVMGDNFFTLFFGWEAVGLFSYLLIGFWYKKDTANVAAMKAFIVNRIGDFGFAVGILAVWYYFGSVEYREVFALVPTLAAQGVSLSFMDWQISAITFICLALFVGAMGKSGQVPLHVWLPDSMEGPTPISALIHAATMVTAGVFMVVRLSPMFEFSEVALATVTVVGALTAWMCATIGLVQTDIKRVIAYSTCSQLGYMFVACGVSAYSAAVFHLMTHAYFKALLFLAAGSVIHALLAEQDIRKMGQLKKYMPVTYITMFVAALALSGIPPFAGFFSKDLIVEATMIRDFGPGMEWVGTFASFAVLTAVFMTAFYTFRMFFLTFHNSDRVDKHTKSHLHESPKVITIPLIILAIGAALSGLWGITVLGISDPDMMDNYFAGSLFVLDQHNVLEALEAEGPHAWYHFIMTAPFWLAIGGIALAYVMYFRESPIPAKISSLSPAIYKFLLNKWYWDELYERIITRPTRCGGNLLWQKLDLGMIDRGILHGGVVDTIQSSAARLRMMQSGMVYHYAYAMVAGLFAFLTYLMLAS
ncbi:MAG: NADH-quinone oxidoreductase subunit L [Zetaproteobacteria bacterium]|nr:NADH-quinone oxidoreductase subunit L [Zetaproteobacteria bacterium]